MGIHRQHLLLPILRCPQCGGDEWTIGAELECAACSTKYRLVEDRPVFHDDPSIASIITGHISHRPDLRFLEMMASTEGLCLHLGAGPQLETFDNVVAVDYKLYPSVDAAVDAHNLPFKNDRFDLVVSLNAFAYLYDPFRAAAEIYRVLKPGGRVIIQTAFLQPLHHEPHHYFNATEYGVRKWFEAFEIEQLTVSYNFHPGVTLSWIVHDILESAERHLSWDTVEKMRTTDLSYWKRVWKDRSADELGLLDEFAKLPQWEQAKVSLGFELVAKTHHLSSLKGYRQLYSFHRLERSGNRANTNVVVHSMGKVGSTSIDLSVASMPNISHFKTHVINKPYIENSIAQHRSRGLPIPYHLVQGKEVYARFIAGDEPAKFIIPFRNPVLRNFSAFFQTFKFHVGRDLEEFGDDIGAILNQFEEKFPFHEPVWWINTQLLALFPIEVSHFAALREKGFSVVSCGNCSLLLLRMDLPDFDPAPEISDFIGRCIESLGFHNITDRGAYKRFQQEVRIKKEKMDEIFDNKFLREMMRSDEIRECYDQYVE